MPSTKDVSVTTFYFEGPASNHGTYIFTLPFYVGVFYVNRNFIRVYIEIKDVTHFRSRDSSFSIVASLRSRKTGVRGVNPCEAKCLGPVQTSVVLEM
jgi:hypothetical protein